MKEGLDNCFGNQIEPAASAYRESILCSPVPRGSIMPGTSPKASCWAHCQLDWTKPLLPRMPASMGTEESRRSDAETRRRAWNPSSEWRVRLCHRQRRACGLKNLSQRQQLRRAIRNRLGGQKSPRPWILMKQHVTSISQIAGSQLEFHQQRTQYV